MPHYCLDVIKKSLLPIFLAFIPIKDILPFGKFMKAIFPYDLVLENEEKCLVFSVSLSPALLSLIAIVSF